MNEKTSTDLIERMKEATLQVLPIIGAFFAPAFWIIILIVLITLIDTRLGRQAARKQGQKITTNRFSDLFAKLIGYGVFICVGLILRQITGWEYAVWLAAIVPIYTEISSIDENQKTLGKKGIITQAEEVYKFALRIKRKRDNLR